MGSQCTITATFAPTVGGVQIATLAIASDFGGTAPAVQLVGSAPFPATTTPTPVPGSAGPGTPPPPEINPSVINFSPETIGVTSGDQIVTLKNQSGIPLVMASTAETITGPFAIGAIDTCEGSTLNANASCVLSLTFTPTGPGSAIGSVTFLDNASGSAVAPQAVQLRGYGTFITLPTPAPAGPPASSTISRSSLNFGAVEAGNTSAANERDDNQHVADHAVEHKRPDDHRHWSGSIRRDRQLHYRPPLPGAKLHRERDLRTGHNRLVSGKFGLQRQCAGEYQSPTIGVAERKRIPAH